MATNVDKRRRTVTVILSIFLLAFPGAFAQTCPAGYSAYDNSCWKYMQTGLAWSDASLFCKSEGGRLAVLNTATRLGVLDYLSVDKDTYIGLFKTQPCVGTGCTGFLKWDMCDGPFCVPPTGGEFLNMDR